MTSRQRRTTGYFAIHNGVQRMPKITINQKRILIDYMEKHPELINNARRTCMAQSGPNYTNLWEEVMELLEGTSTKPTKKEIFKWKKTWSDLKRYVEIKMARINAKSIPPKVTEFEARILKLISPTDKHFFKEEREAQHISMDHTSWNGEDNALPIPICSSVQGVEEEEEEKEIKPNIHLLNSNGAPDHDPLYIPNEKIPVLETINCRDKFFKEELDDAQEQYLHPQKTINKITNQDPQRVSAFKYSEVFIKNVHPSQRKRLVLQTSHQIKKQKTNGSTTQKIIDLLNEIKELEEKRYQEQQDLTNKIAKAVETLATGLLHTIKNLAETAKRNAETIEELRRNLM